jgi:predicted ATPase
MTVVAGSRPSTERAEAVWRRCAGNPFFVRELTRLVLARGGWEQATGRPVPSPDSVRETLSERLRRLPRPCGDLLTVAAVAGPEVVTARVVVLDDLTRFAHELFREAILAALPSARRAELNAAMGRALQELAGGPATDDLLAVAAPPRSRPTS